MPVAQRVRLIDALSATGLRFIEAASFVSPTAIPPMAGARRGDGAASRADPASCTRRWCPTRRARSSPIAAGADELELVVSASETHNQKNVRRSVAESLVGARDVVEHRSRRRHRRSRRSCRPRSVARTRATSRPSGSPRSPATSSTRAPIGSRSATPRAWRRRGGSTICSTRSSGPASASDRIGLHFHNTRGTALANVVAALDRGVTRFDAVDRRIGRMPVRAGRVGQRGDRGPGAHARRHGDRDRHRSRRADRLRRGSRRTSSAASCRARCCTPARARGGTQS